MCFGCSEKGYTFNRSAAAARARGMRPSMEDRRRRLDFSALQVRRLRQHPAACVPLTCPCQRSLTCMQIAVDSPASG